MSHQNPSAQQSLLSWLQPSRWAFQKDLRASTRMLIVAAAVFLPIAGIGVATSSLKDTPEATHSVSSESQGETLARLKDYTRSISAEGTAPAAPADKMLPDVNTMISRLMARLEAAPNDAKGWRMLGWSYFHTAQYEQAATAYTRAIQLDPNSAELKREYEQAKTKASGGGSSEAAAPAQTEVAHNGGSGPSAEQIKSFQAMQPHDREAAIRGMVDGLASRLESSPHDVDGWTRLMRSRVVLGEKDIAGTAFRKALDVFKDDSAASAKIDAAAVELGLKTE